MLCRITAYSGTSGSLSLNHKNAVFDREQKIKKIIDYSCQDRIEKSITCDHHLSSHGKTRNASW